MGASETGATAYKKAGLSVLQLGDEAILRTREFNLNGRDMRPVRQAVTRVRRHGVTVRMRRHRDIPPEDMAAVIIRADDWRDTDTEPRLLHGARPTGRSPRRRLPPRRSRHG